MAAIVQIDQPVTAVAVQAGEQQSLGFDIVNVAGRTLNIVATTVPASGGRTPAWLTVDGERTLRLQPNETRKVTLRLAPPATAPAGELAIRLKVYEVSLPEENNGFSEAVAVTVTPAPPVAPKRPWKLIAAIAAVLALVVAGGGWLAFEHFTRAVMPNVEGKSVADAEAALQQAGIAADAITITNTIDRNADGTVTSQSPAADTPLDDEASVTLTVPRLPVMPDLAGMTLDEANKALVDAGIDPTRVTLGRAPGRQSGRMVAQEPEPGTELAPGTEVSLKLSALIMQLVEGATLEGARAHLEEAGFSWSVVTVERPISLDAGGQVTSQTPGPGTVMDQASPVTLVVPRLPEMPDVNGRLLAQALTALEQAGIPPARVAVEQPLASQDIDRVTAQAPDPKIAVSADTQVTLTVPRRPGNVAVPPLPDAATRADAERILAEHGLNVLIVEERETPGLIPGLVLKTIPPVGSLIAEDGTVRVHVLSTMVDVPRLRGQILNDRLHQQLRELESYLRVVIQERVDFKPSGCVFDQSRFDEAQRGGRVIYHVVGRSLSRGRVDVDIPCDSS